MADKLLVSFRTFLLIALMGGVALLLNACDSGQNNNAQSETDQVEASSNQEDEWTALFDGKSLEGWVQKNGTATYEVIDGTIVGTTVEGSPNSFLTTEQDYGDFELMVEVKVDTGLNSGIQIRSKTRDEAVGDGHNQSAGRVIGPQVEIESSGEAGAEAGYIYSEGTGNGWITPEDKLVPHTTFKDGEWNQYRIVAQGPRIQTFINGEQISDLTDQEVYQEFPRGFIGLQVHGVRAGSGPYQVAWRDIRIKEL